MIDKNTQYKIYKLGMNDEKNKRRKKMYKIQALQIIYDNGRNLYKKLNNPKNKNHGQFNEY